MKTKRASRNASISLILHKAKSQFCIPVLEEHGHNFHFWFPPCKPQELKALWEEAPALGPSGLFEYLGGEWMSQTPYWGSTKLCKEYLKLWRKRYSKWGGYAAHICCDHDSYLVLPDCEVVFHQGYDPLYLPDGLTLAECRARDIAKRTERIREYRIKHCVAMRHLNHK